ncbi:hypothetical protein [Paenibacillus popilliae]|uniref:Transcriptional regulator n=1 Tax=Paenibacillus popilliae ATCC 14706 TaxID=1212764 RepID=M9L7I8_PAEPP|nr:hypothetical protein [Paenibacillus popilliae]GAC40922.1 transcriptional regulator [Paenibacillus popilliae ATCC 14706]
MNKKWLSVILFLTVLVSAGCFPSHPSNAKPNEAVHADDPSARTGSKAVKKTVGGKGAAKPRVVSDLHLEQIAGEINNIYYANGNQVLIAAAQLYLYDLGTKKIVAQASRPHFKREKIWATKNGYAAVRETQGSGGSGGLFMTKEAPQYHCFFYDANLRPRKAFKLDSLLEGDETMLSVEAIAVAGDGSRVAYATTAGLYLYDWQAKKKKKIIDLAADDASRRFGLVTVEHMGFTDQDKRIAFKAQSFDVPAIPGKASFDTCGIVNTDGSALSNRTFTDYTCRELTAYDQRLLLAEDFTTASGRMLVMETASGKTKLHTLTERVESGNIAGSSTGRYFAAPAPSGTGWNIRIYNTDTGAVEAEQFISCQGKELYMANEPIIKVVDESRTCLVLLGSKQAEIESKMVVSQF